jgi:hypothetical protein
MSKMCVKINFVNCAVLIGLTFASCTYAQVRQIPGEEEKSVPFSPGIYESVPDIDSSASDFVAAPDRWQQFYKGKWYDPYNQNILKGDIPVFGSPGEEWFFETSIISDTLLEGRRLPIPVGGAATNTPGANNIFGNGRQSMVVENLLTSFALIRGDTTFRPPDYEFRFTPVFNFNYVDVQETGILRVDPTRGNSRADSHIGFQELFADVHLANLSERYDFLSVRAGIQKFISDFRGFVYSDEQPGVRLFGNYDNNKIQYNLAWFSRLDKDVNSGLNSIFDDRHEDLAVANLYLQDALALGHTLQFNAIHREDRAGDYGFEYDDNGFLVRPSSIGDQRPKNISSTYLGITGDGHFDRINTTSAFYYVLGSESHNQIAQRSTDIRAGMIAQEISYDIDWIRLRASALWASGDHDPYDGVATGFDSIIDTPNFAGGDLSFWQRQGIPFIGGGGVNLVNRNSFLANLRPGKEMGQSNFVNPGLRLYNVGVDFELTPKFKLINNISFLQFDATETLNVLRHDGSFSRDIGFDLSTGFLYRPFLNNNVQIRFGVGTLITDSGFENLFGEKSLYQVFSNVIFQY